MRDNQETKVSINNMAILRNCEFHYAKLDPARPNARYNKENPTWELQIRTSDPAVKKQWESEGIKVKAVLPEDGTPPYWFANLRKKLYKKDGEKSDPVVVKDAELNDVDPNSIGNMSTGNVRIFQYDYPRSEGGTGKASVLMGVQLLKHIVYVPKVRDHDDDFAAEGTTEVIAAPPAEDAPAAATSETPATTATPAAAATASPALTVDPSNTF
jgi:hypothetical protein